MKTLVINAGFGRRLKGGKSEGKNVTGIKISGLDWYEDQARICEMVRRHRPDGEGWSLQGFALVRTVLNSVLDLRLAYENGTLSRDFDVVTVDNDRVYLYKESTLFFEMSLDGWTSELAQALAIPTESA